MKPVVVVVPPYLISIWSELCMSSLLGITYTPVAAAAQVDSQVVHVLHILLHVICIYIYIHMCIYIYIQIVG